MSEVGAVRHGLLSLLVLLSAEWSAGEALARRARSVVLQNFSGKVCSGEEGRMNKTAEQQPGAAMIYRGQQ